MALVAQGLAHHFFGQAVGVEVGGVDHIHAGVERDVEHALGLRHVHRAALFKLGAAAEGHGAQDDFGHQQA